MAVRAVAQHAAVGLLEVSWLRAPLWAAVQRPGELQVVCRLCFGSCCADVRLMAEAASSDCAPYVPH